MTIKPECPRCHKTGLVRSERVFKAGVSSTEFNCHGCGHTWQERDGDENVKTKSDAAQNKGVA
jgi:transposase-like protein